ncbi:hypothetical protein [Agaribacter marinus]|uniref:Uncharacterized protein n=1 Tax=Agaribacter marinus TaxID=1431249 RepID=A0AA37SV14_9ALTE|nr:hypothetical protein [Agaribacter marinus]GLR69747.1 hypothetical protein GCM10007852_06550 [Agaribacter marinus]
MMTKMNRLPKAFIQSLAISVLALSANSVVYADSWEPVAAESLIELPVNLMEKRIQQDFNMSPLASELNAIEQDMATQGEKIKSIQTLLSDASKDEMFDEKVALVKLKSGFLDAMQSGQLLRQSALEQKIDLYQEVLEKLYSQQNTESSSATFKLQQQQNNARARMEKVMSQVDAAMSEKGFAESTPYADEFAKNLAKIEKLRSAINQHKANISPMVDGVAVSTEEYVRQLLMQAASEQSLLDQESLMLSYMSRLVALDAQALEYAINVESEGEESVLQQSTTPANSIDLFL